MGKVIIITTRKVADIKNENSDFVPITLDDDYKKHFAYYDQDGFLRQTNARFPSLIDELLSAKSGDTTIKNKLTEAHCDLESILNATSAPTKVKSDWVNLIWKEFYKLLGEVNCKDGEPFDAGIYKKAFGKTSVYLACEWPFDEEGFTKPKQRHLDDIVRHVLKDLKNNKSEAEKFEVSSIDWTFVCHDADWGVRDTKKQEKFSAYKDKVESEYANLLSCPDTTKVFLFQHRLEDSYYFLVRFCLNNLAEYDDYYALVEAANKNIKKFEKLLNQDAPDFSQIDPNLPLI